MARKIVDVDLLLHSSDFLYWFLIINFSQGTIGDEELIMEDILGNAEIDREYINCLTSYTADVFDEKDGYADEPKSAALNLSDGKIFYVDFHPGDVCYFIDEREIGSTGPHWKIHQITFRDFLRLSESLTAAQKLLLMPMVRAEEEHHDLLVNIAKGALLETELALDDPDSVCEIIFSHCS